MDDRYKKNSVAALAAIMVGLVSGSAMAGGFLDVEFNVNNFSDFLEPGFDQYKITNPYWPLNQDGNPRSWTYIGETEDECVINIVAYKGNMYELSEGSYAGFKALEIKDTEWVFEDVEECGLDLLTEGNPNNAITEETFDWYAQDNQGSIWYLGEASQTFGDGCELYPGLTETDPECFEGSWEAGKPAGDDDEQVFGEAGIVVPSDEPIDGEPLTPGTFYMQEVAFEAEDMAKILRLSAPVEDAYEDPGIFGPEYEGCRKVKEWTALEPGASVEHKWYCPGPGLVRIEGIGGGRTEVEELVSISPTISPP